MKATERLEALRLLRDLQRDLFDAATVRVDSMGAHPTIFAFTNAVKDLIARTEATLAAP